MKKQLKPLFKTEAKHIDELRNCLAFSSKLNGTRVILHGENEELLRQVVSHLSSALLILNRVKW